MESLVAPYAPPSAVLGVIRHYRKMDVPEKVTLTNLRQVGVTETLAPRTLAALRFLGLADEDGVTTDRFRAIRFAKDNEYQQTLVDILNESYHEVFAHVDLATAGDRELGNAFIPYSPGGQRERMITLFLALCQEAGMTLAVPAKSSSPRVVTGPRTSKPAARSASRRASAPAMPSQLEQPVVPNALNRNLLFGVTEDDINALPDDEFDQVWAALGKVARARSRAAREREEAKAEAAARSRDLFTDLFKPAITPAGSEPDEGGK
ncbi:MAG: DUF5343 domain-containing protein [Candidatus Limnocylindrales bacterium]